MSLSFTAQVYILENSSNSTKAFASLIIDGVISINGFTVKDGQWGLWVAPPSKKSNKTDDNGKAIYYDDVRFLDFVDGENDKKTSATRNQVYDAILKAYNEANSSSGGAGRPATSGQRPDAPKAAPARW